MSEEEKKAIERVKRLLSFNLSNPFLDHEADDIVILLNLIEKQNNKLEQLEKENKELKANNYELKNTYRNMAKHFENIGKQETAEYMLAQIGDVPAWVVDDEKDYISKYEIRQKIDKLKREFDFYAGREHAEWQDGEFDGDVCDDIALKIGILKELLGEENGKIN